MALDLAAQAALETQAEQAYGLPEGILASIREQETGNKQRFLDDPAAPHYTGANPKSSAFGLYGILENSTAKDPGYGVAPLASKSPEDQVQFAAQYLAARTADAGSLAAGLAGYGEGEGYANQVLNRAGISSDGGGTNVAALGKLAVSNSDAAAAALEAFSNQYNQTVQSAIQTYSQQAKDAELITNVEETADLTTQRNVQGFAAQVGIDPNATTEALSKLLTQSQELFEKQREIAGSLANAGNPSSMFDRPVRWFADYLLAPYKQQQLDSVTKQLDSTNSQIKWMSDATQNYATTANIIKNSRTSDSVAAKSRQAAAAINQQANEAQLQAIRTNALFTTQATELKNNAYTIARHQQQDEMQRKNFQLSQRTAAMRAQELELALKDKSRSEEASNSMLDLINTGLESLGLNAFKSPEELQVYAKTVDDSAEVLSAAFKAGHSVQAGGPVVYGSSPYSALRLADGVGVPTTPAQARVINWTRERLQVAQSSDDPALVKSLSTASTVKGATDAVVLNDAKVALKDITQNAEHNIYAAPPLETLLEDENIAKSYLGSNILTKMQAMGDKTIDFQRLSKLLVDDIKAGKIDVTAADSELGFLGLKIQAYNNAAYQYTATAGLPMMDEVNVRLGEVPDPKRPLLMKSLPALGIGQMVAATYGPSGKTTQIVNLIEPVERFQYLNKVLSRDIQEAVTGDKLEGVTE